MDDRAALLGVALHQATLPADVVRRMSFDTHWNLTRMTALLTLSRELADGRVGVSLTRPAQAPPRAGSVRAPWRRPSARTRGH